MCSDWTSIQGPEVRVCVHTCRTCVHVNHTWVTKYNDVLKELELIVQTFHNSGLLVLLLVLPSLSVHLVILFLDSNVH